MHHTDVAYVTYTFPGDNRIVEKKFRTYYPYHREKVAIAILPEFPLSGQPLADVERDVISYQRYVHSFDCIFSYFKVSYTHQKEISSL